MRPGPKPIHAARLKVYAWSAARLLFLLRDGREGSLLHEDEVFFTIKPVKRIAKTWTRSEIEAAWKKLKPPEKGFFAIQPPINPAPELWEKLKAAGSDRALKNVAAKIAAWDRRQGLGYTPAPHMAQPPEYDFVRVLRENARTILEAKELPEYPESKRKKSDDKRVWFFAKILAGLMFNRSPLYTLKRLSRWRGFPELNP